MNSNIIGHIRNIPPSISLLREHEQANLLARFEKLVELRAAPSDESERGSQYAVFWPRSNLQSRVIPGGITSLDAEEGFDYDICLEKFFSKYGQGKIYFWGIGAEKHGMFSGPYNEETRWWIKRELVFSPTVIIASTEDIVLIADEQWHYSVIGASRDISEELERVFGGPISLKEKFLEWANGGFIGFGDEGRQWAYKYPIRWCGWRI